MLDKKKLLDLVDSLIHESFYEGREHGLFNHTDTFHSVTTRQKMLNHKALGEQIKSEIRQLINQDELIKKES